MPKHKVVVYLDYGEIYYVDAQTESEAKAIARELFTEKHKDDLCTEFINAEIDVDKD